VSERAVFASGQVVAPGVDFGYFQVVEAGDNRTVDEGTPVTLFADVHDPDPTNGSHFSFLWKVVADNGQVVPNGTAPTFNFTPRDDGAYTVTLSQRVGGVVSQLAGPVTFNVALDPQSVHTMADQDARWQFQEKLQALRRGIAGSLELATSTNTRLEAIKKALDATPPAPRTLHDQARSLQRRLAAILVELQGDRRLGSRSGPAPVAISERANTISSELNRTLARPTMTHEQQYQIASELFAAERAKLNTLVETDVPAIERELERLGAPYTPGRIPRD